MKKLNVCHQGGRPLVVNGSFISSVTRISGSLTSKPGLLPKDSLRSLAKIPLSPLHPLHARSPSALFLHSPLFMTGSCNKLTSKQHFLMALSMRKFTCTNPISWVLGTGIYKRDCMALDSLVANGTWTSTRNWNPLASGI